MSSQAAAAPTSLTRFVPPYERLLPQPLVHPAGVAQWKGSAVVWRLTSAAEQWEQYEWLVQRPYGQPLFILLPHVDEIEHAVPLLRRLRELRPRAVVPGAILGTPEHLRALLSAPPRSLARAVADYLAGRGVLLNPDARKEVLRILELSFELISITQLARRMYTSRRSLGRHFAAWQLPVPSHWLQFGRLLHACVHLQCERTAAFRIAARMRYPDGFTMSNQMKRLLGYRPSEVRKLLGWEWLVESWLEKEGLDSSTAM